MNDIHFIVEMLKCFSSTIFPPAVLSQRCLELMSLLSVEQQRAFKGSLPVCSGLGRDETALEVWALDVKDKLHIQWWSFKIIKRHVTVLVCIRGPAGCAWGLLLQCQRGGSMSLCQGCGYQPKAGASAHTGGRDSRDI